MRKPRLAYVCRVVTQATLNVTAGRYSENRGVNELAMNSVYAFFNAALNSELDYRTFYLSMPDDEADQSLRKMMATPYST